MCGIFGYVGKKNAVKIVIDGLKRLEYRGYDSAGIAGVCKGRILDYREVGKVCILEKEVEKKDLKLDVAIAHTRWATHGEPNQANAHPHFDMAHSLAIVHNGIIENYAELKKELISNGVVFSSETDTEVIAHLIASHYHGDISKAVQETLSSLKGAFAIAVVHKDHPHKIVVASQESPMVIGIGQGQSFVSSDYQAFAEYTDKMVFLENGEMAVIEEGQYAVYNFSGHPISKEVETISMDKATIGKGTYAHYTLKEIFEQPRSIKNAYANRFNEEYGTAYFEGLKEHTQHLQSIARILILACGTSWHAGLIAAYMIEKNARIPVQVEISSEFRYKNPIIASNTLVIAISQSGETADTIAAVREIKAAKGAKIFSLCNVLGSTLVRESDYTFFLNAGPEIGVCSTKAFTSQLVILSLFALYLGRMKHMTREQGQIFLDDLQKLPQQVDNILDSADAIKKIAKKYAKYENFFFIGRQQMYPTSLEGALKLKEISYINAVGYPAGEMKHGPIALINELCPTVALCANKWTFDKMISNLMEVKARKGQIIAVCEQGIDHIESIVDEVIWIPSICDDLAPITTSVALQLLAYYIALERGADIDQPRNLAKSVTVE